MLFKPCNTKTTTETLTYRWKPKGSFFLRERSETPAGESNPPCRQVFPFTEAAREPFALALCVASVASCILKGSLQSYLGLLHAAPLPSTAFGWPGSVCTCCWRKAYHFCVLGSLSPLTFQVEINDTNNWTNHIGSVLFYLELLKVEALSSLQLRLQRKLKVTDLGNSASLKSQKLKAWMISAVKILMGYEVLHWSRGQKCLLVNFFDDLISLSVLIHRPKLSYFARSVISLAGERQEERAIV